MVEIGSCGRKGNEERQKGEEKTRQKGKRAELRVETAMVIKMSIFCH